MYEPEIEDNFVYSVSTADAKIIKSTLDRIKSSSPYVYSRSNLFVYHEDYAEHFTHIK